MRTHGTLTRWNDDRGFGFITPAQGREDVFVHVSAFPHDGQRPRLGEVVSYEIDQDAQGKPRAVRVMRPGQRAVSRADRGTARPQRSSRLVSAVLSLAAIAAIGAYAYSRLGGHAQPAPVASAPTTMLQPAATPTFQCDGRTTCGQMNSCPEARYFIRHCPGTTMDGDGDGVPCEQQWCN